MTTFFNVFTNVILFTALVIPGYILGKTNRGKNMDSVIIGNILTNIAMPFLVFSKLLETDFEKIDGVSLVCCILLPFVLEVFIFVLTKNIFKNPVERFCSLFPNCGFLGIPLAAVLFPEQPEVVVYVALFNVFSTFLLLTLGVYILSGDKNTICLRKALCSPISLAVILGMFLSLSGIGAKIGFLYDYSSLLAQVTTPLSMISLGFGLSGLEIKKIFSEPNMYKVSVVKLVIAPILCMSIIVMLKHVLCIPLENSLTASMFIATAVSTAASASAMSEKYGQDEEYAAMLTMGNTILCVITLPVLYLLVGFLFV